MVLISSLNGGSRPKQDAGATRSGRRCGLFVVLLLACSMPSGCRRAPEPASADPVVAVVDGRPIHASRLALELKRRSGDGRLPVTREPILQDLIDLEAAYAKASSSGFLDSPEMQQAIRLMVVERYRGQWEQAHPLPPALSDERLRESYSRQTNRFMRPEAINVAMIRLELSRKATPEKRAEVIAKTVALAERTRRELGPLSHFGPVAAEYSADQPTRYRGGELGWMTATQLRERLPAAVAAAAQALGETGSLSDPIVSDDGVFLLRLMGRRAAALRPMDEVRPQLGHELMREARAEADRRWSVESRAGLDVTIHREALEQVPLPKPASETRPAPAPMGPR